MACETCREPITEVALALFGRLEHTGSTRILLAHKACAVDEHFTASAERGWLLSSWLRERTKKALGSNHVATRRIQDIADTLEASATDLDRKNAERAAATAEALRCAQKAGVSSTRGGGGWGQHAFVPLIRPGARSTRSSTRSSSHQRIVGQ